MRLLPINRSLSTELVLRLALPLGVFAMLLMVSIGLLAERREREVIGESLARTADQITASLDKSLADYNKDIALMASLDVFAEPIDRDEARVAIEILTLRQPGFTWIGRTDAYGKVLVASRGYLENLSLAGRPIFDQGRERPFIGDLHEVPPLAERLGPGPNGEPQRFMDISRPVLDHQGEFSGILASQLSWPWLRSLFEQTLQDSDRARGVELMIVNRQGVVLSGPGELVGKPLSSHLQAHLSEVNQRRWQELSPSDEAFMFAWAASLPSSYTGELGWKVVLRQPSDRALQPVRELRRELAASALLLVLGMSALAWIQARRITRPLARIAGAAESVTAGAEPVIPTGSALNEVESLATALQHMVNTLTRREQALDKMQTLAHRDPLTGLHNRRALSLQMEISVERAQRRGEHLAFLALDLDGFKPVNDLYGHAAGDAALREVAKRLQGVVRKGEMLARIGGDEFVVMLQAKPERIRHDAEIVAERILACFNREFSADGHLVPLGCSIGAASGRFDEQANEVLRRADEALYEAKQAGKGCLVFAGT